MSNLSLALRFAFPLLAWGVVFHDAIEGMVSVWLQSKTYEHSFLILPISLWLVWRKREQIKVTPLGSAWIPVVFLIVPALLWMVGNAAGVALFEHIAVVTSLQLMLWALLGTPLTKLLFFPIFYLIFCIPFGEELVPYLQLVTADITVFALHLTNIPVYREGLYLTIPNGMFEVAEACSGIRFLISSLALGTLFAYLSFSKWWKILAFVGFSFIFPIIANGIRAYGIILVGYLSDMKYATGADHLIYGWVFFTLVIGVIFFVADKFADPLPDQPSASDTLVALNETALRPYMVTLTLVVIFSILFVWTRTLHVQANPTLSPVSLPEKAISGYQTAWGVAFPEALTVSRGVLPEGRAEYFSARYAINQANGELISSINRFYDPERWAPSERTAVSLSPATAPAFDATMITLLNPRGQSKKILYWYCIEQFCSTNPLKLKLFKAQKLLTDGEGKGDVFALSSSSLNDEQLEQLAIEWINQYRQGVR